MNGVAILRRPTATARPARPRKPGTHHSPVAAGKSIPGILVPLAPPITLATGQPKRLLPTAAGGNDNVSSELPAPSGGWGVARPRRLASCNTGAHVKPQWVSYRLRGIAK